MVTGLNVMTPHGLALLSHMSSANEWAARNQRAQLAVQADMASIRNFRIVVVGESVCRVWREYGDWKQTDQMYDPTRCASISGLKYQSYATY
jgi:hypothetical protein